MFYENNVLTYKQEQFYFFIPNHYAFFLASSQARSSSATLIEWGKAALPCFSRIALCLTTKYGFALEALWKVDVIPLNC